MNKINKNGFALVLSLILMLVMSLMGGALIVITSNDHKNNNVYDNYQQTFYVAETALLEGEKYLINQFLGPWDTNTNSRNTSARQLPINQGSIYNGAMTIKNYTSSDSFYFNTSDKCYKSFKNIDKTNFAVVISESWNFGKLLYDSLSSQSTLDEIQELERLQNFYYEFFITQVGSAPFRGTGSSIKATANNNNANGVAYRIYGCGIHSGSDGLIVTLESILILPK
jgi:Tfp pilus assembly protein PilX